MHKPIVSVLMLAYNHEEFVGEAIKSIINQRCDFDFELIIGEDASADETYSVCMDYQQRYPSSIQVFRYSTNVGMHGNFANLWNLSTGKYIAFCEGDDFWCDFEKLQKQMDFFMENPDCTLCGTITRKIAQDEAGNWNELDYIEPVIRKKIYEFEELIPGYNFHFSSVMVIKDAVSFPDWFATVYCVDRPLYLLATNTGKAGLIPEITSVYRLHQGGIWSAILMEQKAEKSIDLFVKMKNYFDPRFRLIFDQSLSGTLWFYMSEDMNNGNIKSARKIFWKSIKFISTSEIIGNLWIYTKLLVRLYAPQTYSKLKS